jgi:hypothetical protein
MFRDTLSSAGASDDPLRFLSTVATLTWFHMVVHFRIELVNEARGLPSGRRVESTHAPSTCGRWNSNVVALAQKRSRILRCFRTAERSL